MPANPFVKLSVVASSLLLGAAFVSYRAGAFDWPSRSQSAAIRTPTLPPRPTVVAPPRVAPLSAAEQQIFYGSKSGAVFVEPQSTPQPTPPAREPAAQQSATPVVPSSPVIMSGSKSLMPAAPPQKAVKPLPKGAAADPQSRRRPLRPRRTSR